MFIKDKASISGPELKLRILEEMKIMAIERLKMLPESEANEILNAKKTIAVLDNLIEEHVKKMGGSVVKVSDK